MKINQLNFKPLFVLSSKHLQTILSGYCSPGAAPPSESWLVELSDGDKLSCEVSIPKDWMEHNRTVALVHGLGGSHSSSYMVRMARKLYLKGHKVVRINLRGCGSGYGLSKLPYNAGNSQDVLRVLQSLKRASPSSEIDLIGFSLGGNIILKLAGELEDKAGELVKTFIAVCAPLDLAQTVRMIEKTRHRLYHYYYLKKICRQARGWFKGKVRTLYEFDDLITAPLWGYKNADDYYKNCSSLQFLSRVQQQTHLIFAEDDPFISLNILKGSSLSSQVHLWTTKKGGHMGFLGATAKSQDYFWLDELLVNWSCGLRHT